MKNVISLVGAPILTFFLASPAVGQSPYLWGSESLGLIHNASIEVIDQVDGGCWTNAELIKQKDRLTLEQSGVNVYLEPVVAHYPYAARLYIRGFGTRHSSSLCYGAIEVSILDTSSRFIGDNYLVGDISYFQDGSVALGSSLNSPFSEAVKYSVSKLAAEILSGRREDKVSRLIEEYGQELRARPETREEMRDRLGFD